MIPDFRSFVGKGLSILSHSAKGSTWDKHMYVKIIDGDYYYPDDYEGGRHLDDKKESSSKTSASGSTKESGNSNESSSNSKTKSTAKKETATSTTSSAPKIKKRVLNRKSLEEKLYDNVDETLKQNPNSFDPKKLASGDLQSFRLSLAEFAGVKPSELSDEEVKKIQDKVIDYYSKERKIEKVPEPKKVNLGTTAKKKVAEVKPTPKEVKKVEEVVAKVATVDLERVYSVYNKKRD